MAGMLRIGPISMKADLFNHAGTSPFLSNGAMSETALPSSICDSAVSPAPAPSAAQQAASTAFPILAMLSVCHLLNDMIQSLLPAIYPLLKDSFRLDFGQIGLITLTFQITASLLQP